MFGVSVVIRDKDTIYRSYHTTQRGAEYLGSNFSYLDLTPMGRQKLWEGQPGRGSANIALPVVEKHENIEGDRQSVRCVP